MNITVTLFQIPDEHLGGFTIYDASGQPIELYSEGSGIPNTDTVLYVKKQHTSQCDNSPVSKAGKMQHF